MFNTAFQFITSSLGFLSLLVITFPIAAVLPNDNHATAANMPFFAAHVSDELSEQCKSGSCNLHVLDGNALTDVASTLSDSIELEEALNLSEYEVLIGNAAVYDEDSKTLNGVFEITTTWRNVPIDDITINIDLHSKDMHQAAFDALSQWQEHVKNLHVLEAPRIYEVLNASNYFSDLSVPAHIGEFTKSAFDIYRDPMLGSITRYIHPEYNDAIVDVSVYPLSPFQVDAESKSDAQRLNHELISEAQQIQHTIEAANISDFSVSNIEPYVVKVAGKPIHGYRLAVMLNSNTVPVYSTHYVFLQNDKVIKLNGNVPSSMMAKLVAESLPHISVPSESVFMKHMRQG